MGLKIFFLGFCGDPSFAEKGWIYDIIGENDCIVKDLQDANILLIGCFLNIEELNLVFNFRGKKILYFTEPIEHFDFSKYTLFLFENNIYDYVIGLISNCKQKNHIKNNNPFNRITSSGNYSFQEVNHYVKTIQTKQFCTLINRHDPGNTRLPIYTLLSRLGHIDCPGKLLNNMSNEGLNKIGNVEFIRKYMFNICSENFMSISYNGYISEKLLYCCLAGSIPIYYGKLDEDDKKIYNMDRIIFIEKENPQLAYLKVKELLQNPNKLVQFYVQDVFMPTAQEECDRQNKNILELFHEIRNTIKKEQEKL